MTDLEMHNTAKIMANLIEHNVSNGDVPSSVKQELYEIFGNVPMEQRAEVFIILKTRLFDRGIEIDWTKAAA